MLDFLIQQHTITNLLQEESHLMNNTKKLTICWSETKTYFSK